MPVIPELLCPDPGEARRQLVDVFGFVAQGSFLQFGSQTLCLAQGDPAGHGVVDHIALAVPDVDTAAARMMARGAMRAADVTPDEPKEIPEFWAAGVRYLFLAGPGGARIELITNLGAPQGPGHDHIGIPCTDIAATKAFLAKHGAQPKADFTLLRPEGATQVSFLTLHGSVLELYQPPTAPAFHGLGRWRRLLVHGITPDTGPDSLTLAPL